MRIVRVKALLSAVVLGIVVEMLMDLIRLLIWS